MAMNLHVALNGNRNGNGALASLEAAREAIRMLKRTSGLPAGGVIVNIAPGIHVRESSFELGAEDSGTQVAPIVYRSTGRGRATITGGVSIDGFLKVTDRAVLARLAPEARRHVRVAHLKAAGITNFGTMQSRGFGRKAVPAGLELFFNGVPMTMARWPNVDFTAITGIVKDTSKDDGWGNAVGAVESGFYFKNDRIKRWVPANDIWVHGYWCWDWANTYERVVSIDKDTGLIRTAEPYGMYGFRADQRFFFLNVLEELDQPGEWYLDRANGLLYFWPPSQLENSETMVSMMDTPLVVMNGVSNIRLENLSFECVRGHGVMIEGGSNVTIAGCAIRNTGNHGVVIKSGTNHRVVSCDIAYTGDTGVDIEGGDRKTITPCNHVVENCHIHDFSRWSRCYCPAIHGRGVGMRFANNRLHHAPHTAILFWGNEFSIENNEIYQVCLETGDAGAIYIGRDYTFRGNVVRNNFIHHMGGVGMGTMGIYNDDCVSGTLMEGNVFYRCTRAAMLGGGRELRVINNLFVDCRPAISFDARGVSPNPVWQKMVNGFMKEQAEKMNYLQPPYITRYPELKPVGRYLARGKGVPPENCLAERNICVGGQWLDGEPASAKKWLASRRNMIVADGVKFRNLTALDLRLATSVPAKVGFRAIPMDRIGIAVDTWRKKPAKRHLVHAFIEKVKDPLAGKKGVCPAICRLVVENRGREKAAGWVHLSCEPARAGVMLRARPARETVPVAYRLRPGQTTRVEFEVNMPAGLHDVTVCAALKGEEYIRHRLSIRVREEVVLAVLGGISGAGIIGTALRNATPLRVLVGAEPIAEIRMGVAGTNLALHARVRDGRLVQESPAWTGSCVEVFVVPPGKSEIRQVFLTPAGGNKAARGLVAAGKCEKPLPGCRVESAVCRGGYELAALVPLKVLGVEHLQEFLFEIQVGTAPAGSGARQYGTASGVRGPAKDPAVFILARVAR